MKKAMSIEEIMEGLAVIASQEKSIQKMCDDRWRRARAKKSVSAIRAAVALLKTHPEAQTNNPLTPEQIQEMAGKPVWCEDLRCWGIVKYETVGGWKNRPFLVGAWHSPAYGTAVDFEYDIEKRGFTLYRRPPKEEQNEKTDSR